jgi:hypothetical protein
VADDSDQPRNDSRLRVLVFVVVTLVIIGVAELVKERAGNKWFVFFGAITATAVQLWFIQFQDSTLRLLEKIQSLLEKIPLPSAGVPTWVKAVMAGVTGLVLLTMIVRCEPPPPDPLDCPHTTELRILTSPEGFEATREVAQAYAASTARANRRCPTVFPYVYAADTSAVSGALARGWVDTKTDRPLVDLGPRPDIWLPDSTLDVRQVHDILVRTVPDDALSAEGLLAPLKRVTSVGSSPIVLAGSAAPVPPDGAKLPAVVSALLAKPGSALSAADPESSAPGLLAATGYLHNAQGEKVDLVVARRRQQIVSNATSSQTDEVSVLCSYARSGDAPAAVLTSLRTWRRLLAGKALGGAGCQAPIEPSPDLGSREPEAPVDGPVLDYPFVQFTWTSRRHELVVDDFRNWLGGEQGRGSLREAGLDGPLPECTGLERNGCIPGDLAETLDLYRQAKRSGRVLLAVDASGSMAEVVGSGRVTRFAVAKQGVTEALGELGPHDEFGLWLFPRPEKRGSPELVGIAPGSPEHRERVSVALRKVRPEGPTPLYATILAGMRAVSAGDDNRRIRAFVVLTDGEDTTSELNVRQVAKQVGRLSAASGVRLYVIATGDARCDDLQGGAETGLRRLTDAGHGECLPADPGKIPGTMTQVFGTLWKGQ